MKIHKHNLTNLITKKNQRYHKITSMYKYLHLQKKTTIKVSYNNDVSLQNALSHQILHWEY